MPRTASGPLPELLAFDRLVARAGARIDAQVVCEVDANGRRHPVPVAIIGSSRPDAPAVGYFGGVHGLERVGAAVVLSHLQGIVARLEWDHALERQLESIRMVFMPVVNPGGMALGMRANPNGVDLMRNAPVDARERVPFLVGGQRVGNGLPWYRGVEGAAMEPESSALCAVVQAEMLSRPFSIAVDCHSGFGLHDRIWFPFAHTREPIEHLADVQALSAIFDEAHASHRYVFEPQSRQYLAHGDLWDHLYLLACRSPGTLFLPTTLEMGSWTWVRKNPLQLLSREGIFNPLIAHRMQRVLRQHTVWLDFAARAAESHARWVPVGAARERARAEAIRRWYAAPSRAAPRTPAST
ncbi:MAG: DUF2817 domain-containing protein [Lautropia sp.]